MKQVIIKNVRVQGFRSYINPVVFNFDTTGLFWVSGFNGTGKTTLFSALIWVIYGVNLNGNGASAVQTYKRRRDETYKGTRVVTEIRRGKKDYLIARHLKYKGKTVGIKGEDRLMIFAKPVSENRKFVAEDLIGEALYKGDQQQYINRLMGLSSKAFINSIIFGQRLTRLVSASGTDKRELFEDLGDLGFIDEALTKANADWTEKNNELTKKVSNTVTLHERILHKKNNLIEKTQYLADFEERKQRRIAGIKQEGRSAKIVKAKLEEAIAIKNGELASKKKSKGINQATLKDMLNLADISGNKLRNHKSDITDLHQQIQQVDKAILNYDNENVKLAAQLRETKDTCSLCGQPIKGKDVVAVKKGLQDRMDVNDKQIRSVQNQREIYVKRRTALEQLTPALQKAFDDAFAAYETAKATAIPDADNGLTALYSRLEAVEDTLTGLSKRLADEKAEQPPAIDLGDLQADLTNSEEEEQTALKEVGKLTHELKYIEWWTKIGFSAKGMKSYIFSAMLQRFNTYAAYYGAFFGYGIKFYVDLTKTMKPFVTTIYEGEDETDYADLSGGQKQRVDVCIAFAMHDLVCSSIGLNIMVMDEIFEGLDVRGVEMVNTVMQQKSQDKAVYMITHNPLYAANATQEFNITGGDEKLTSQIN